MEPNPNCQDCHGTGEILLLNRTVKCFCLDRKIEIVDDNPDNDPLGLNRDFLYRLRKINDITPSGWEIGI